MDSILQRLGDEEAPPNLIESYNTLHAHVTRVQQAIAWSGEAKFMLDADEYPVIADKVQWIIPRKRVETYEGILTLTTKHLIFEQEENAQMAFGARAENYRRTLKLRLTLDLLSSVEVTDQLLKVMTRPVVLPNQASFQLNGVADAWKTHLIKYAFDPSGETAPPDTVEALTTAQISPDQLLTLAQVSENSDVRAEAAYLLLNVPDLDPEPVYSSVSALVPPLTQAVKLHMDAPIPAQFFENIASIGDVRFVPVLEALIGSTIAENRDLAANTIARLRISDEIAPLLLDLTSTSEMVRHDGINSLSKLNDQRIIPSLKIALQFERKQEIRDKILVELLKLENRSASTFEDLAAVLRTQRDPEILNPAIVAIRQHADRKTEISNLIAPLFVYDQCEEALLDLAVTLNMPQSILGALTREYISLKNATPALQKLGIKNPRGAMLDNMGEREREAYLKKENSQSPSRKFWDRF